MQILDIVRHLLVNLCIEIKYVFFSLLEVNSRTLPHNNQGVGGGQIHQGVSSTSCSPPVSYNKILMQNTPPPPPNMNSGINLPQRSAASNQRHFV